VTERLNCSAGHRRAGAAAAAPLMVGADSRPPAGISSALTVRPTANISLYRRETYRWCWKATVEFVCRAGFEL